MFVDEQGQIFPVERADVEQRSRALAGSEAQGDVFSPQCHISGFGRRQCTAVPAQLRRLLEDVGDGCG